MPFSAYSPWINVGDAGSIEPVGASFSTAGVFYRVWAPGHSRVTVFKENSLGSFVIDLEKDEEGYFSGLDEAGRPGDLYRFKLNDGTAPDPASRFQPQGVEGPSEVVDPGAFGWSTHGWKRPQLRGRVIYELHIGTFTQEGTFEAAIDKLDALVELGVNTIELLPVADFAGERNWGYDGVMLFAPTRCYGRPDDLRALVDAAHERGLAVIVDVVYNHLGPVGNVLPRLTPRYFRKEGASLWGTQLNFDDAAAPVRNFFLQNACMWLDEYRFDGLRLDAVHAIEDHSSRHIIADLASAAHARGAFVIAEDERNEVKLIAPGDEAGWGVDAVWADDFHHAICVGVIGRREGYYGSFEGTLDEWVRILRDGWLYQGQFCPHRGAARGTSAGHRPAQQFVHCISNHDQTGNRPCGDRLNHVISPEAYRAVSMLLCFSPYTPMLFMGQEWGASTPFVFFTDLPGKIGEGMAESRKKEFEQAGMDYDAGILAKMPDPQSLEAFVSSKLNWSERGQEAHQAVLSLYRACLPLRAQEPVFQSPERSRWSVQNVGLELLGIRWQDKACDWLLIIGVAPGEHEAKDGPFIRNTVGKRWQCVLASNDPEFGGRPTSVPVKGELLGFSIQSPGAVLFREIDDTA